MKFLNKNIENLSKKVNEKNLVKPLAVSNEVIKYNTNIVANSSKMKNNVSE